MNIMKSSVIATLGLLLILFFSTDAFAQLAKQGEFTGTGGFSGKALKVHLIGETPTFIVAEFFGATKNDAGSGLYHNTSFDCTFSIDIPEMPKTIGTGYCTVFDSDKDTFTIKVSEKGVLGVGGEATTEFINGTGKYKGITGSGWYKALFVPDAAPGTFQGFFTFGGNYKLP